MKKSVAILLTVIGGLLANALICMAGVFLYPMSIFIYAAAEALLLFTYGGLLTAVTGIVEKRSAVPRKVLYICAQAPFLAAVSVNFIIQLVTTTLRAEVEYSAGGDTSISGCRSALPYVCL